MNSINSTSASEQFDFFEIVPDELLPKIFFQIEDDFNVTLLLNKSLHNRVLKMVRIDEESALRQVSNYLSAIDGVKNCFRLQIAESLEQATTIPAIDLIVINSLIQAACDLKMIPLKTLRELSNNEEISFYVKQVLAIAMANAKMPRQKVVNRERRDQILKDLTNQSNWPQLANQVSKRWAVNSEDKENSSI